jgi:hypothetical protein
MKYDIHYRTSSNLKRWPSLTHHEIGELITKYFHSWRIMQWGRPIGSLLQQTSVQAVWFASTQAVPGTACGAPPVM